MSDLISRADAIEAVRKKLQDWGSYAFEDYRRGLYEAQDIIEALPSADAVKVAYFCDGRKCNEDCSECCRTFDIEHARDFKRIGGTYYQQESADAVSREKYDKLIQELNDSPKGKWIPLDGKLPKIIGEHVLVTIKWADDDLEVCEMCPTVADRYNIIAFQQMPLPYDGEPLKSELQCSGARMKGGAE